MSNPRFIAVKVLNEIENNNSFSNILLSSELRNNELNKLDASLVSLIVYGVLQRKLTLDFIIKLYSNKSINKLHPFVANTLRTGIYQIIFMDKIPASAAVNESVKIINKSKQRFAAGFVNAVLRKISIEKQQILEKIENSKDLSIKYSCDRSFIDDLFSDYDKQTAENFLNSSLQTPKTYARVNFSRIDSLSLFKRLNEKGITVSDCDINGCFEISGVGNIESLSEFKDGLFYIQDLSSQIAVSNLDIKRDMRVLDVCAAPGGKSFTAAGYLSGTGMVTCCDIYKNRVNLIKKGAERLGFNNISAIVNDASVYNCELGLFDRIICDVPCSGYGVIRRKPEIRYKSISEFADLPNIQYEILRTSVKYLDKNGKIMYSTCTVRKTENRDVVERFLRETDGFEIEFEKTLMPNTDFCDGFYFCILKRTHNGKN